MVNKTWKWFIMFQLGLWSVILGHYYFGLLTFILEKDVTYLSVVILLLTLVTSIFIGVRTMKSGGTAPDMMWFISDAVLSIGMVGTLCGFLLVLGSTFADIDPSSIESMSQALSLLATGMSTALLTTLVGLISSLFLKSQLVILEE